MMRAHSSKGNAEPLTSVAAALAEADDLREQRREVPRPLHRLRDRLAAGDLLADLLDDPFHRLVAQRVLGDLERRERGQAGGDERAECARETGTRSAKPGRAPRCASHTRVRYVSAQKVSTRGAWFTIGWPPCSSCSTALRAGSCVLITEIMFRLPLDEVPCRAWSSTRSIRPAGSGSGR